MRAVLQQSTECVLGSSGHRVAGDDVLADGELVERSDGSRRENGHLARPHILFRDHALHTAVVVDMGMGVDHPGDRFVADVLADQRHALASTFDPGHAVDHDEPVDALDNGELRDVVATHLVDAVNHLEQATLADQLRLPPQTRIDRIRRVSVDVVHRVQVEDHMTVIAEH